jgi:hypothetical protein
MAQSRQPECPHCGWAHKDAWDWNLEEGSPAEVTCENESCEKPFCVTMHVAVTYSTRAPLDPADNFALQA